MASGATLNCRSCDAVIVRLEYLCAYEDIRGSLHLGLREEHEAGLKTIVKIRKNYHYIVTHKLLCKEGNHDVGTRLKIDGVDKASLCFTLKKTCASGHKQVKNLKELVHLFPEIKTIKRVIPDEFPPAGMETKHYNKGELPKFVENATPLKQSPYESQWISAWFAAQQNTMLYLKTGVGKTLVACMVIQAYVSRNPEKGAYFLVPRVVLVDQQAKYLERETNLSVARRSGQHARSEWAPNAIVVSTPEYFLNQLRLNKVSLAQASIVVFDEAHETRGSSSYEGVLSFYLRCSAVEKPRLLALSASPVLDNKRETMEESIRNLLTKFEAKIFSPTIDKMLTNNVVSGSVDKKVAEEHVEIIKTKIEIELEQLLNAAINVIGQRIKDDWPDHSNLPENYGFVRSVQIEAMEQAALHHDVRLLALAQHLGKWISAFDTLRLDGPVKLANGILTDYQNVEGDRENRLYCVLTQELNDLIQKCKQDLQLVRCSNSQQTSSTMTGLLAVIRKYVSEEKSKRIIIFVKRRSTAYLLNRRLSEEEDLRLLSPQFIVGGNKADSPTPEQRGRVLAKFSSGESRLLIGTNVLEQGLDVECCGLVICLDGIHTMTSLIQARGRAREALSKFIIFCADARKLQEIKNSECLLDGIVEKIMDDQQQGLSVSGKIDFDLDNMTMDLSRLRNSTNSCGTMPKSAKCDVIFRIQWVQNVSPEKLTSGFAAAGLLYRYILSKDSLVVGLAHQDTDDDIDLANLGLASLKTQCWVSTIRPPMMSRTFSSKARLLSSAYFVTRYSVKYDATPIWEYPFDFRVDSGTILLENKDKRFTVGPAEIKSPILVHAADDAVFVFVPMSVPPLFTIEKIKTNFDWSGRSFTLALTLPNDGSTKTWQLRSALNSLTETVLDVVNLNVLADQMVAALPENVDFDKEYVLRAWHSTHCAALPGCCHSLTEKFRSSSYSLHRLKLMLEIVQPRLFVQLKCPQSLENCKIPALDPPCGQNYVNVGRVKITPYRVIVLPRSPVQANRVLRHYASPENLLLVSVTDDHDGNPWTPNTISWFRKILEDGIKIGGRRFRFLGCSNSQLREGHCWFSCDNIQDIHAKIGALSSEMNPGRKLTRLALAFAGSTETLQISQSAQDIVENDIKENGVVFSDGIGRISCNFRDKIVEFLGLKGTISAFQIRVGGIKGVVAVYKQEEDVVFRKSMKKFECISHRTLEVLAYSRCLPLRLNRQSILCMASLGGDESIFMRLMEDDLNTTLDCLKRPDRAMAFLREQSEWFTWDSLPADIMTSPLFKQIMYRCALQRVSNIVDHAQVSVPKGRVLMGVLDETGTLDYGQVYVHIVERKSDLDVEFDQQLIVFRNPVVFPSDIRILRAVRDVDPRIRDLYVNCVVFPSRGKASHPQECAGGDLDGDLYSVIWDEKMFPKKLVPPGMPVPIFETRDGVIPPITDPILERQAMINFFCDYVYKCLLGVISNAHLVMADIKGFSHPDCIELGMYVAAETDAPKKGFTVKDVPRKQLPQTFPDFMRKSDKMQYPSQSVLGRMFRSAEPILETLINTGDIRLPEYWRGFIGHDSITSEVESQYKDYSAQLSRLIKNFELEAEADLFSGCPIWRRSYMSTYKQEEQLRKTVTEHGILLWGQWEIRYRKWISTLPADQMRNAARIWYQFPNLLKRNRAYSFSWLAISDIEFYGAAPKSLEQGVVRSLERWSRSSKLEWYNMLWQRQRVASTVVRELGDSQQHGPKVSVYGSSLLGFSEHSSDIDLCLLEEECTNINAVRAATDDRLDEVYAFFKSVDASAKRLLKPNSHIEFRKDGFHFEVTTFADGVKKTNLLANIMDANPFVWLCLRVLAHWGRSVHILKSCGSKLSIMPLISFAWLFVYFLREIGEVSDEQETVIREHTLARWAHWLNELQMVRCSKIILRFFEFLASNDAAAWICTKVDPVRHEPLLAKDLIPELAALARQASFILALNDGAVDKLFEICSRSRLFKIHHRMAATDPRLQEQYIAEIRKRVGSKVNTRSGDNDEADEFDDEDLNEEAVDAVDGDNEHQAFKKLSINEVSDNYRDDLGFAFVFRSDTLYLEVTGDPKKFAFVEATLERMRSEFMSSKKQSKTTFHVVGSTIIIPEGFDMNTCLVCFEEYHGDFNLQHMGCPKRRLGIPKQAVKLKWREEGLRTYMANVSKQLDLFETRKTKHINNCPEKRFFGTLLCIIRTGEHYLFNVGTMLEQTFVQPTLSQVTDAIRYQEERFQDEERTVIEERDTLAQIAEEQQRKGNASSPEWKQKVILKKDPTAFIELAPLSVVHRLLKKKSNFFAPSQSTSSIRHSFFPKWRYDLVKAEEFAISNGFVETENRVFGRNVYHSVCVYWRGRELVAILNDHGMLDKLRFRSTRWVSTTIKSAHAKGDDVRMYIESRADVTDEALLCDVLSQYTTRSMLTTDTPTDIDEAAYSTNPFPGEPIVPDFFGFDWEVRSIRRVVTTKAFEHPNGATFILNVVHSGTFDIDTHKFIPGSTINEIEIIFPDLRQVTEVAELSYDLALKLFDYMASLRNAKH